MSNIPEARRILVSVLSDLPDTVRPQVDAAIALLTRRPPAKPRGPVKQRFIDADTAARIRTYVREHPDDHIQDVAERFGTNSGRVSEAIHHDR